MELCSKGCFETELSTIKINFIDRLMGRTIEEKLQNSCHVLCLKSLQLKNIKRNGKWGFVPILGIHEAFSSLIALFSFFINLIYFRKQIRDKVKKSPMGAIYLIQHVICNFTFLASFVYHARETPLTRNADYFTAVGGILIGTVTAVNRVVLSYKPSCTVQFQRVSLKLAFYFFLFHIHKITLNDFDYGYNKVVCGVLFLLACLCNFLVFYKYRKQSHSKLSLYSIAMLVTAGAVEILDKPPFLYLVDTHAMWHAFMAVGTFYYIKFISLDIDFQTEIYKKQDRHLILN